MHRNIKSGNAWSKRLESFVKLLTYLGYLVLNHPWARSENVGGVVLAPPLLYCILLHIDSHLGGYGLGTGRIPSQDAHNARKYQVPYGNVHLQDRLAGMEEEARQHREQVEREEAALDRTITGLRAQLLQVRASYLKGLCH